ncbi:Type IV secretion system protein virB6, partial [Xanthomonas melonis]|nr:Type IV secretion system protein virB6 [Xanthomonas melonis]MCD0265031.1 Type IV secretion system protein virB6 [Xanthomonas melonis]
AVKFIPLASAEGLSSQALQQGGIGLIMTMLIITIPTIAAALWQGNMGTFLTYTAFNNTAAPGPQGQPAGSYMPQRTAPNTDRPDDSAYRTNSGVSRTITGADASDTVTPGARGLAGQNSRTQG